MTPTSLDCHQARRWLSATRDGEAAEDPQAQQHLSSCAGCESWSATFDRLTRVTRLRAPLPSNDLRRNLERVLGATPVSTGPLLGARVALWLAAIGSAGALVLAAFGVFGHTHLGSPEGRDAEAFLLTLTVGYALTAWRPARLAPGFLPVAVLAAVVTATMSAVALASGETSLAGEVTHLPILIGAGGAAAAFRATVGPSPTTSATRSDLGVRRQAHV
jgi:predicted anti-sigma-YlaC factor YlaD